MKVVVFGATGMIGQGVVRDCLLDPEVTGVLAVGRTPTGVSHAELRELMPEDLFDLSRFDDALAGSDACFFCLGVSAAGTSEPEYRRITYDLTLSVARHLLALNPELTFVYVSGQGTDRTGRSRMMWARVKGQTENALLDLPMRAYMFRPGFIQPRNGARSSTRLYRAVYAVTGPLLPALERLAPSSVTTTEKVGRAMLVVARQGYTEPVLGNPDINTLAAA